MKKLIRSLLAAILLILFGIMIISPANLGLAGCNNKGKDTTDSIITDPPPKNISYSIIKSYPHDTSSFTQGLVIYNGALYESTGDESANANQLMKVDLATGKIERSVALDKKKYFGEGITILRDTIYQLTWKEKTVFVYTLKDFKKVNQFSINTEGWGITTDGKELIVSDGTSNLYYYESSSFRLLRTQEVTEAGSLSHNLNELEYIDGYVYANQWQYPYILKVDPNSGQIVAKADLTDVWKRVQARDPEADVPNGIAYDAATKKIYVTGKVWPDLYEIQFGQ
jgi:glutamine cyclotransferase